MYIARLLITLKTKKTLLCITKYHYIIAMNTPKIPKTEHPLMKSLRKLGNKPVFGDLEYLPDNDIGKSMQGLLGNYLLRQMTPKNLDIDLFEHMLKFKPNKNFEVGVQQKGKDSLFNLNWRF